jgi:hypothetical protein
MTFTRSNGTIEARVYERLRKRSYRRWWWSSTSRDIRHRSYVAGVRDAIAELQREGVL